MAEPTWISSNAFWSLGALGVGVVVCVLAAAMKSLRLLLFPAWLCFVGSSWFYFRSTRPEWAGSLTSVSGLLIATGLVWLYWALRPQMQQPVAAIEVICDSTHAEIVIRNDGVIADFWGRFRITGEVRDLWDRRDLFCRWELVPAVRSRVANGGIDRIVLARQVRDLHTPVGPTAEWIIYAICDDQPVEIRGMYAAPYYLPDASKTFPSIVLEGSIIGDPDLANGIQHFRVTLEPFRAVCG
jgi:hypothetical protein